MYAPRLSVPYLLIRLRRLGIAQTAAMTADWGSGLRISAGIAACGLSAPMKMLFRNSAGSGRFVKGFGIGVGTVPENYLF